VHSVVPTCTFFDPDQYPGKHRRSI
jgi:hypothetical protein